MKSLIVFVLILIFTAPMGFSQVSDKELESKYQKEVFSAADLEGWNFYGIGKAFDEGHRQFCITEADESKGAMIVSPVRYGENVVVRYKAMTLTPAAVLVAILSANDIDSENALSIPKNYDGSMPLWMKKVNNYFFAFRNGPHNFAPFVRKYPEPGNQALASAKENVMHPGVYYDIEVGRAGGELWLKVDGKLLFKAVDSNPLPGGKIAFRTRGTAGFKAAFLMKDLEIYSK